MTREELIAAPDKNPGDSASNPDTNRDILSPETLARVWREMADVLKAGGGA